MVIITQGYESLAFDSYSIDEKVINPIDEKLIKPIDEKANIAPLINQQTLQLESLLHYSVR